MINKYFLEEPNILDLSKEIFNAVVDENLKIETNKHKVYISDKKLLKMQKP